MRKNFMLTFIISLFIFFLALSLVTGNWLFFITSLLPIGVSFMVFFLVKKQPPS